MTPSKKPPQLWLLDAMALIYRAHFALIRNPVTTRDGRPTSAILGVTNTLMDILQKQKPSHLAVAMDTSEPTHRHEEFSDYKAQRDAIPEDLEYQIPLVLRLFEAFRIPILKAPGYEADDIIGTLSRSAPKEGFEVTMVTPDKDYHQLVRDAVRIYKPGRQGSKFEILGVEEVLEQWKIDRVDQVIDILGLMGDASDNVPGVPGVGIKTAQKYIAQFGSVETLLDSTDQLKGKQRERLEENREQALLSKRLVTISTDVPLEADLASFERREPDAEALSELFRELEFETLGKRVLGDAFQPGPSPVEVARTEREKEIQTELFAEPVEMRGLAEVEHAYHIVQTAAERAELLALLSKQSAVCFDTETTGLDARRADPLGIAFAFEPHEAWYVVCPEDPIEAVAVLEEFRPFFEDANIEKIGHNLKYDLTLLRWKGLRVRGKIFDTLLAHSMKEPEMRQGLDYLAGLYLGYRPIPTSALIGERGKEQKSMRDVPLEQLAEYACEDADVTLQVSRVIRPDIEARGVAQVCYDVECPLVPVLVDMEFEGIRLDREALECYAVLLTGDIEALRKGIWEAAGREFNIDSPKQLGIVLFEEMQLEEKPKKTATGQYSTREAELLRLSSKHAIIADVLDYRNAVKLKSVYVDQLPGHIYEDTGRLHTHYGQTWTATGRMQSNHPNLQTIPIRKERGKEIRRAFVPRDDEHLILAADYSQVELRILADLSGDPAMREAFESGVDIHQVTASKVWKVDADDVTSEMRNKAKAVNFGIVYGISAFGLQQRLNIPRKEAAQLIDDYFELYSEVRTWIDSTIEFARENGYVKTRTGRRRYLRDIDSRNKTLRAAAERLAMNSPIQGTAADLLKLAMIRVHQALEGRFRTRMLLTVHDEIVFDLHEDERESAPPVIEECMRTALPMEVPLDVEMGIGDNWLEAH